MERWRRIGCGVLFALLAVALFLFLRTFTQSSGALDLIDWQSASAAKEGGAAVALDMGEIYGIVPESGVIYTFSGVIERVPEDGTLIFETAGAELSLFIDGAELFRSSSFPAQNFGMDQARVTLPEDAAGKTLEMTFCIPSGRQGTALFPPIVRVMSWWQEEAEDMGFASHYAIPAGAYALALLLVCGLLLLGVAAGKPDWKLLALIVALIVLTARDLMVHLGHYFLPEPLLDALAGGLMLLVPPAAMLVYLTLNRRRDFWRLLGRVSAWAGGVLTAAYLVSLAHGGRMATLVNTVVLELFRYGVWEPAAYWLSVYLVGACAGLALWGHIRSIAEVRAEAQTLALKTELAMQSSHAMEQSSRKTAELRHELKNHVAAMNALYAKGDTQGLAQYLSELDKLQTALMPARYTEHFLVNAILQNAAATAAENGVRFEVHANVPEDIGVEERDLSALLMNMLDNALEAVRRVEPESARFIRVSAEQKNGFFAISCKNTYAPPLKTDERGRLITTKADASAHGFGMKQMRAVAEKYHSILDVSYTGDVFTVQTALKTKQ